MTHGDKAKGKKTASKASGSKKSSKAVEASKASKAGKEGAGGKKAVQASPKAVEAPKKQQAVIQKAGGGNKASTAKGSNGKPAPRGSASPEGGFSNPVIANAFKRAIKKFPAAFRKLTD